MGVVKKYKNKHGRGFVIHHPCLLSKRYLRNVLYVHLHLKMKCSSRTSYALQLANPLYKIPNACTTYGSKKQNRPNTTVKTGYIFTITEKFKGKKTQAMKKLGLFQTETQGRGGFFPSPWQKTLNFSLFFKQYFIRK